MAAAAMSKKRPRSSVGGDDRRKSGASGTGGSPGMGKMWYDQGVVESSADKASAVMLQDFLGARTAETRELTARLPVQGVVRPREILRRRAASFRPYKLPLSIRLQPKRKKRKVIVEGMEAVAKLCRKRRRARKNLAALQGRERKEGSSRWLETHLWHTKRMRMQDMWGYRLALCRTDASERASVRWATNDAVIHDASYYACIELSGPHAALVDALNSTVHPADDWCAPCSAACTAGGKESRGIMHRVGEHPQGAVGPVRVLWESPHGRAHRRVWVWVHPACVQEALALFDKCADVHAKNLSEALARIELRGQAALGLVLRLVRERGDGDGAALWAQFRREGAASLPDAAAVALTAWDPRLACPSGAHHPNTHTRRSGVCGDGAASCGGASNAWSAGACAGGLWDTELREQASRGVARDVQIHTMRQKNLLRAWGDCGAASCPLLAVFVSGRGGHVPGIDLVVPAGWGSVFWKEAVRAGGKAVGQRERDFLCAEWGGSVFPRDWPDAMSGGAWADTSAADSTRSWEQRPSAVRIHYKRQGVAFPFGGRAAWDSLFPDAAVASSMYILRGPDQRVGAGALVGVFLTACARGTPKQHAHVHIVRKDKGKSAEDEDVVGRVTAGGYSWRRGRGWGYALVRADTFLGEMQAQKGPGGRKGQALVGVRNLNGGEMVLAWARPDCSSQVRV